MRKTKRLFDIKEEYNSKLDYLICKNIVSNFSQLSEELHIRNCYYRIEIANEESEKNMCLVKDFFNENDVLKCQSATLKIFYKKSLKVTDSINLKFFDELLSNNDSLFVSIIRLVDIWNQNNILKHQDFMFRLMLVILCLQKERKLIIPYYNAVNKIKEQVKNSVDKKLIKDALERLFYRTQEKNVKHTLDLNKVIRENLEKNKENFVQMINAKYLGLVGSFALNQENEYSDVDLIVVMEHDFEELDIKQKTHLFWKDSIPINMDIVVVKEEEMRERMTPSMLKTFKRI